MITDELRDWITQQSAQLKRFFPTQTPREEILARMVKLSEEVGELADEVLSSSGHQRKEKLDEKDTDDLAKEFADVVITTLILAEEMNIDVSAALRLKIDKINARFEKMERGE